jgi:hypothetical protein
MLVIVQVIVGTVLAVYCWVAGGKVQMVVEEKEEVGSTGRVPEAPPAKHP